MYANEEMLVAISEDLLVDQGITITEIRWLGVQDCPIYKQSVCQIR